MSPDSWLCSIKVSLNYLLVNNANNGYICICTRDMWVACIKTSLIKCSHVEKSSFVYPLNSKAAKFWIISWFDKRTCFKKKWLSIPRVVIYGCSRAASVFSSIAVKMESIVLYGAFSWLLISDGSPSQGPVGQSGVWWRRGLRVGAGFLLFSAEPVLLMSSSTGPGRRLWRHVRFITFRVALLRDGTEGCNFFFLPFLVKQSLWSFRAETAGDLAARTETDTFYCCAAAICFEMRPALTLRNDSHLWQEQRTKNKIILLIICFPKLVETKRGILWEGQIQNLTTFVSISRGYILNLIWLEFDEFV